MAVQYRTQGFVLTKKDLLESDQVFDVFTKDFGKIKILGKAIRKINSKLRAGLDIFYLSEIEFVQGKAQKTLIDAIAVEKFKDIRNDLAKLAILQKIAESADELIKGQEKDEKIWNLFLEAVDKLNQESGIRNQELIYYYFMWGLLSLLGYQIDLYHCVKCQEKLLPEIMNFSAEQRGIICLRCSFDNIKDKIKISPEAIKLLRLIQAGGWPTLMKIRAEKGYLEELELILSKIVSIIVLL